MASKTANLVKFSWGVLVYNIFVILFGAFVRATGSGAGCGAHWPLCNGVVIPRPQQIETVIEFTHRITSGLCLVLVAVLVVWVWRTYPKGSLVRTAAALAVFFTITEALVGASLVLFGWVADDDSYARAISMMVHLVNTFLLLGALTATAWWATVGEPRKLSLHGLPGALLLVGAAGMLLLGASGAITALGDTLFPSTSTMMESLQKNFSPESHYLIRLRVYHPGIAIGVGVYLYLVTGFIRRAFTGGRLEAITNGLFGLYALQIILGAVNVILRAPVWMQIVHLLVSNLIWIVYILLIAVIMGGLAVRLAHQPVHKPAEQVAGK